MNALGEVFAVLACIDLRAALTALRDIMGGAGKSVGVRDVMGLTRLTPSRKSEENQNGRT
jgi:hypothetical protein